MKRATSLYGIAAALFLFLGHVTADEVGTSGGSCYIRFDEPVVPESACRYTERSKAAGDDKTDLFDITGDDAHRPTARWQDQNRLVISFPHGSSCATEYRLSFRPGCGKYLSEKPMPQTSFTFHRPDDKLDTMEVPGMQEGAALVFPGNSDLRNVGREVLDFSPESAVTYTYRHANPKPGEPAVGIPATVAPAQLKHGLPRIALQQWAAQKADWEKLNPESVLPGVVLVQPERPLPEGVEWELCCEAPPHKGFASETLLHRETVCQDLESRVSPRYDVTGGEPTLLTDVGFSAPITGEEARRVFREAVFSIDGTAAVNNGDGTCKTLKIGDKVYTFRLGKLLVPDHEARPMSLFDADDTPPDEAPPGYVPQGICHGFSVKVEGECPVVLDIALPKGVTAALGRRSQAGQKHRLTLNPAWPNVEEAYGLYRVWQDSNDLPVTLLPLKGEHKVCVPMENMESLSVTAYRIPADMAVREQDTLSEICRREVPSRRIVHLKRRLLRHTLGIEKCDKRGLQQLQKSLAELLLNRLQNTAPQRLTAKLEGTPEQEIPLPPPPHTDYRCTEAVVDLDTLCGGTPAPGMYLLKLSARTLPSVRAALKELELAEETLDADRYILVQVSNLRPLVSDTRLLLTRLSDGKAVPQAKVTLYKKPRPKRQGVLNLGNTPSYTPCESSWELTEGYLNLPRISCNASDDCTLLIEDGEDYYTATHYQQSSMNERADRALMHTDRTLYRPGDDVHVRGILRLWDTETGTAALPEAGLPLTFRVVAPDGKNLAERTITADAAGAFEESFRLPTGEEDVAGEYRIVALSADGRFRDCECYIRCEVFRRDSFLVDTELVADKIAPKDFTLRLTATDFNGTPVAGAKTELSFSSPLPLLRIGDKTYCPAGNPPTEDDEDKADDNIGGDYPMPAPPNRSQEATYTLTLNAEGKAEVKGTFSDFLPTDSGHFTIRGSVANDREEYVSLKQTGLRLHPADFSIRYNIDRDRLFADDAQDDATPSLKRGQKLHVSLQYTAIEKRTLPNGFVFATAKPGVSLMEKDIVLPADCRDGQPVGASDVWREFAEKNEHGTWAAPQLAVSGTDPAGREIKTTFPMYMVPRYGALARALFNNIAPAKVEDGQIVLDASFPREGTAFFILTHGRGARMEQRDVHKGQQIITLPLKGVEGDLEVKILLMLPDAIGNYSLTEEQSASLRAPLITHTLNTQLRLPEKSLRPGAPLHLEGRVTDKDGKGSPAVLTIYAVDKGMLFLRGSAPDLVSYFTEPRGYTCFNTAAPYNLLEKRKVQPGPSMIPGLWGNVGTGMFAAGGINGIARHACAAPMMCAKAARRPAGYAEDAAIEGVDAAAVPTPCAVGAVTEESTETGDGEISYCYAWSEDTPAPRLRTDFRPVAFWLGEVKTDAGGNFSADIGALPDTLTTYSVFALVLGEDGTSFGNAEGSFTVNQNLMLTPGAPLFMSTGDTLSLPLNVTQMGDAAGTWEVTLKGDAEAQKLRLAPKGSGTLYFSHTATGEGENTLEWLAKGEEEEAAGDAVEARFPVRYPAPLLKEVHHLVLEAGQEIKPGTLLAPELATSSRGEMELQLSANPLLHLAGCMDFLLSYPYGCTEQTAGGLLPWLFYDRLAPVSPLMAQTPAAEVHRVIAKSVEKIFDRQRGDGGLGYWDKEESCGWASAYAGLVMTIAKEQGADIPADKLQALQNYLKGYLAELRKGKNYPDNLEPLTLFAIGRSLGDGDLITQALGLGLARETEQQKHFGWFLHQDTQADLRFIAALRSKPAEKHSAFLQWMRARGHDYRHTTTWRSGWMLIALHEYLRLTPASNSEASVQFQDGQNLTLGQGITTLPLQGNPLSAIPTGLKGMAGTTYAVVNAKAQPERTEYPGVTEKGLQITRIYEKKGTDGIWREASDFAVGDVVRVTLTCAKAADELEYFVLEDYLPSCMEAINPNIPSQAAGLEWQPWSSFFDHKEYLADRVRGFCTRWHGRDLLNMSYYARVKRAGTTTAPPAQARLMYEPQTYGLSPNKKISTSRQTE